MYTLREMLAQVARKTEQIMVTPELAAKFLPELRRQVGQSPKRLVDGANEETKNNESCISAEHDTAWHHGTGC